MVVQEMVTIEPPSINFQQYREWFPHHNLPTTCTTQSKAGSGPEMESGIFKDTENDFLTVTCP